MGINFEIIQKNLGTYSNAYGLQSKSDKLVNAIQSVVDRLKNIGLVLRDPINKKTILNCQFPPDTDYTESMIWVPVHDLKLEALPYFTCYSPEYSLGNKWRKVANTSFDSNSYDMMAENAFILIAHRSLRTNGVIEKYNPSSGYGFIRRRRSGIFFHSKWCNYSSIMPAQEVSFYPIICRQGLQARHIQLVSYSNSDN